MMAMTENLPARLRDFIPADRVLEALEERIAYARDGTQRAESVPDVVVRAASADEVEAIVALAHEHQVPITPRGAGTSTTGGAIPVKKGIVLDLTAMNRIKEIDTDNLVAVVEPGVVTGQFHTAVEKLGLFYPPDPASRAVCTLGGNAAMCAGGPRGVKYGVTKDYIIGLEAVTPAFGRIRTGVRTMKGVVGYDLTKLLVGSEGTLGVITEITLRLIPKPEATGTMTAAFPDPAAATETVSRIIASRIIPSMLEFLDQQCIRAAENQLHAGLEGTPIVVQAVHEPVDLGDRCDEFHVVAALFNFLIDAIPKISSHGKQVKAHHILPQPLGHFRVDEIGEHREGDHNGRQNRQQPLGGDAPYHLRLTLPRAPHERSTGYAQSSLSFSPRGGVAWC